MYLFCLEICLLGTALFCPCGIRLRGLTKAGRFVFRMVIRWLVSWRWMFVPSHMDLSVDSFVLLLAQWLVSSYYHESK